MIESMGASPSIRFTCKRGGEERMLSPRNLFALEDERPDTETPHVIVFACPLHGVVACSASDIAFDQALAQGVDTIDREQLDAMVRFSEQLSGISGTQNLTPEDFMPRL